MCLIQPNVVMLHVRLQHRSLLNLISPESEDGNTIPKATIDVYQIESSKLLAGLLLLSGAGEPLLDK